MPESEPTSEFFPFEDISGKVSMHTIDELREMYGSPKTWRDRRLWPVSPEALATLRKIEEDYDLVFGRFRGPGVAGLLAGDSPEAAK